MSSTSELKTLWDSFLARWSAEALTELSLSDYTGVGNKDTFCYWLETKTRPLGSIQGNNAIKFGIYQRSDPNHKRGEVVRNVQYGDEHSWYTRFGDSEQQAFESVKQILLAIVAAAQRSDVKAIDEIDFSPMVKWKLAFLYQPRSEPVIANIFSAAMFKRLLATDANLPMSELNRKLLAQQGEQDLLSFVRDCWQRNRELVDAQSQANSPTSYLSRCRASGRYLAVFERFLEQLEGHHPVLESALATLAQSGADYDFWIVTTPAESCLRFGAREHAASTTRLSGFFVVTAGQLSLAYTDVESDLTVQIPLTDDVEKNAEVLNEWVEIDRFQRGSEGIVGHDVWPCDWQGRQVNENEQGEQPMTTSPLNQILYGPPGTGKTYHTVTAAVKAADFPFYQRWKAERGTREELQERYEQLVNDKRIAFVTFHQSYGYEEFVEGLRANSDKGQISYDIEPGIFKKICDYASADKRVSAGELGLSVDSNVWKLSLDGTKPSRIRDYCFEHNIGTIGWGEMGDQSSDEKSAAEQAYADSLKSNALSAVSDFTDGMELGDVVLCVSGQHTIQAVGVVSGDYEYWEQGVCGHKGYRHVLPINWLATGLNVNILQLNANKRLTLKTCYKLSRISATELVNHLASVGVLLGNSALEAVKDNYVLIIDEINRGNISKIFGELITLIEPSKRQGQQDALSVNLSYSGKKFSVPDNLYLIGTMNTADRSLALIDTALRRRFTFTEMMPDSREFKGAVVKVGHVDIDLACLLDTLNQRIEVLFDREHTLGHAFFIEAANLANQGEHKRAFDSVVTAFKHKIVPLLQEYFYDDWQKIALVLSDNQKPPELRLVNSDELDDKRLKELFGSSYQPNRYGQAAMRFSLVAENDVRWDDARVYCGIYDIGAVESTVSALASEPQPERQIEDADA
ncbi:AAA family ATPase [Aliagarivorans marinus]|uniref:AAA family ATPase n=1 Tax=Aliagarivorans marinus TaxID=561965 RepID=UPI00041717C1|nr:AAA family ATPase [Aliagarivorans marinus]